MRLGRDFSLGGKVQRMRLRREEDWEKTHGIYMCSLKERGQQLTFWQPECNGTFRWKVIYFVTVLAGHSRFLTLVGNIHQLKRCIQVVPRCGEAFLIVTE